MEVVELAAVAVAAAVVAEIRIRGMYEAEDDAKKGGGGGWVGI